MRSKSVCGYIGRSYRLGLVRDEAILPDYFPVTYDLYCKEIEQWYANGKLPSDAEKFSFNFILPTDFNESRVAPSLYSAKIMRINDMLKTEKTVVLSSIASVRKPRPVAHERALVFTARDFKYPFSGEILTDGWKSDALIEQYDIIIKNGMADKI